MIPKAALSSLLLGIMITTGGALGLLLSTTFAQSNPVFVDNFNTNVINSTNWNVKIIGTGPSVIATNQRIEISLPANSLDDSSQQVFGGALATVCPLGGDFDIQADYNLLVWPQSSGVRVGVAIEDPAGGAVERIGFGPGESLNLPREAYLTHFADGVNGVTGTGDLTGTLRLVRVGNVFNGYYLSAGNWTLIYSGPATSTGDLHVGFQTWSHNFLFGNQAVTVGFDNFIVNSGHFDCPKLSVTPNSGVLGALVTVQGSGFPTTNSVSELEITFDSQLLGLIFPQNGSFTFQFNVPHSDPTKLHHIHAIELFPTSLDIQADFTVLPEPSTASLSVSIDSGMLYFPGDTAVVYVLTTQAGSPLNVQLQMSITWPNGTTTALSVSSIGTGLYKGTLAIPETSSTGTYAIVATATSGTSHASALRSFEVKSAWNSPGGPSILHAFSLPDSLPNVAILGMVIAGIAVMGLAYLTRKIGK